MTETESKRETNEKPAVPVRDSKGRYVKGHGAPGPGRLRDKLRKAMADSLIGNIDHLFSEALNQYHRNPEAQRILVRLLRHLTVRPRRLARIREENGGAFISVESPVWDEEPSSEGSDSDEG